MATIDFKQHQPGRGDITSTLIIPKHTPHLEYEYFTASVQGIIIGYAIVRKEKTLVKWSRNIELLKHLVDINIDPNYTQQGIAKDLIQYVSNHSHYLIIPVTPTTHPAILHLTSHLNMTLLSKDGDTLNYVTNNPVR